MPFDKEITEVVQFPAIVKGGVIQILHPDLNKLDSAQLKLMADAMGGELIYRKQRATYSELETPLCDSRDCYRPVHGALFCEDHTNGGRVSQPTSYPRPVMVNPRSA